MVYTITINSAAPIATKEQYNLALSHALRTAQLAHELGLNTQSPLQESDLLSELTGVRTFLLSGPEAYGGAIKGEASLGFFEYHLAPCLNELQKLETDSSAVPSSKAALNERKKLFFIAHGFAEDAISDKTLNQLSVLHLALWETFKDTPLMTPTSGSFGLAFLETLNILRETKLTIDNKVIPLFRSKEQRKAPKGDGEIVVWAPNLGLEIMPPDKTLVLEKAALRTDSTISYWKDRNKRDVQALTDALEQGGFFCPTNPKSTKEVEALIEEVFKEKGASIFLTSAAQKTLKGLGVILNVADEQLSFTITTPIAGGLYGLMAPHLHELEYLLSQDIKSVKTYNQPSVGATLAGTVLLDMIFNSKEQLTEENLSLLAKLFPNIHRTLEQQKGLPFKTEVHGAFDVANDSLAKKVGYTGISYCHNNNPANGLGTITPGELPTYFLEQSMKFGGPFQGGQYMHPVPHNFMEIARSLLFAADIQIRGPEARYPESAGAASLGGWLHQAFLEKRLNASDIAWHLRKEGITYEIFEKLQKEKNGIDYLRKESAVHQNGMPEFTEDFLKAMRAPFDTLSKPRPLSLPAVSQHEVLTIFSTGNNGTEWAKEHIKDIQYNKLVVNRSRTSNQTISGIEQAEVVGINCHKLSQKIRYSILTAVTGLLFGTKEPGKISQIFRDTYDYAFPELRDRTPSRERVV